jgi:3-oxoacyl-[acyl-carrier protein] reductase
MDLGIKGKVALVAAASRGLGKAAATELAREGARVVIAARGEEELEAAADEIRIATGAHVLPVPADVTVAADIEALVGAAQAEFGDVDILVNNAGGPRPGTFTDVSDEDWLAAVNLNLMSALRLTRLVLPGMRRRRWGRIINITSLSVKQPLPNLILSNAVRSAVVAMAKTLSLQVAAEGITVNNVCPGMILTDRVRNLAANTAQQQGITPEQALQDMQTDIPMGRLGRPEELAALIAFLASERAAYITGATTQVDGGRYRGLL